MHPVHDAQPLILIERKAQIGGLIDGERDMLKTCP